MLIIIISQQGKADGILLDASNAVEGDTMLYGKRSEDLYSLVWKKLEENKEKITKWRIVQASRESNRKDKKLCKDTETMFNKAQLCIRIFPVTGEERNDPKKGEHAKKDAWVDYGKHISYRFGNV